MKLRVYKLYLSAFLGLFLGGCFGGGFDMKLYVAAKEKFDQASSKVPYSENAAIRFLSVGGDLADGTNAFPDNEQTIDKFCAEGLPKRYGHLKSWFEKNNFTLKQANEVLQFSHYSLRYESFENPKRQDILNGLGRLWLLEAVLAEKKGKTKEAYEATLNLYRFTLLISQDAFMEDFYLAWRLLKNADDLLARYLPTLSEKELKKIILILEDHSRRLGTLDHHNKRKKMMAPVLIQKYLKPNDKDGFWTKFFLDSSTALQRGCDEVFAEQDKVLALKSPELFKRESWAVARKAIEKNIESDIFHKYFFGLRGNGVSSLQRMHFYRTEILMKNELRQFHAAWLLERKLKAAKDITFEDVKKRLASEHLQLHSSQRKKSFKDPYNGKDYRCRVEKYQTLIWSIGPDLKDTDGLFPWDPIESKGDVILKIKHER
jgi:hypothetical protein